jgi:malonate decarboxylase delta subunit
VFSTAADSKAAKWSKQVRRPCWQPAALEAKREMRLYRGLIECCLRNGYLQEAVLIFGQLHSSWTAWNLVVRLFKGTKVLGRRLMEKIEFDYPAAKRRITKRAHVGVVGSGDMEILLEPSTTEGAHVSITTSVNGFRDTWKAVFDRFFSGFDDAANIQINDEKAQCR